MQFVAHDRIKNPGYTLHDPRLAVGPELEALQEHLAAQAGVPPEDVYRVESDDEEAPWEGDDSTDEETDEEEEYVTDSSEDEDDGGVSEEGGEEEEGEAMEEDVAVEEEEH
jgi:hypothetical protein